MMNQIAFLLRLAACSAGLGLSCAFFAQAAEEHDNVRIMLNDAAEEEIQRWRNQGRIIENTAVTAYLAETLSRSFPDRNNEMRVVLYRSRLPNAFALPNGTIAVTTGWLNLMRDESQLVYVLGHEASHYFSEHMHGRYERMRDVGDRYFKSTTPQRAALVREIGQYGRDLELEADRLGIDELVEQGYSLNMAATSFLLTRKFDEAFEPPDEDGNLIRSVTSHPPDAVRFDLFKEIAADRGLDGTGKTDQTSYIANLAEIDREMIETWIRLQRDEVLMILLTDPNASTRYGDRYPLYVAELYRLTDSDDDDGKIPGLLAAAENRLGSTAELNLAYGRYYRSVGNAAFAKLYFQQFLQADDTPSPVRTAIESLTATEPDELVHRYSASMQARDLGVFSLQKNVFDYQVAFPDAWTVFENNKGNGFTASRDGMAMNAVSLRHTPVAEEYERFRRELPTRYDLLELADLLTQKIYAHYDESNVKVLGSRLVDVSGRTGIEYDIEYRSRDGLRLRVRCSNFVDAGYLYELCYEAPALHYFSKELATYQEMVARFSKP